VTIILGGNSFIHKNKRPRNQSRDRRAPLARVRQDGDSTGDPRTKLGNFFLLCYVLMFFFAMNDTLFKSFSMHLYIMSYMV